MNEIIRSLNEDTQLTKELLEVHLNKPEKVELFYRAFKKLTQTGELKFAATFSLWACIGYFWYFLYRKLYIEALVLFFLPWAVSIISTIFFAVASMVGLTGSEEAMIVALIISTLISGVLLILVLIAPGFFSFYSYTKKFISDLKIAGFGTQPIDEVKQQLQTLGGYNNWAIIVPLALMGFTIFATVLAVGFFLLAFMNSGMRW